jgi:translation initiation factor 1A
LAKKRQSNTGQDDFKVRVPRRNEVLGLVQQMLGTGRLRVKCLDGKIRMCRIPGRMRKRVWVREGDVVIVELGDVQSDTKGDIKYRYTRDQVRWLERENYLT